MTTTEETELSESGATIKAIAVTLMTAIASKPEELRIRAKQVGNAMGMEIRASATDTPRLVGRGGQHADAWKLLLREAGDALGLSVVATLLEPTGRKSEVKFKDFTNNPDWKSESVRSLVALVAGCFLREPCNVLVTDLEKVTLVQIQPAYSELEAFPKEVEGALRLLLDVIGKSNGRLIQLAESVCVR